MDDHTIQTSLPVAFRLFALSPPPPPPFAAPRAPRHPRHYLPQEVLEEGGVERWTLTVNTPRLVEDLK